jgi:hypothetical protein
MIRCSRPEEWVPALSRLIDCGAALPRNVAAELVNVLGFSDEAAVRQDPEGVSAAIKAARQVGDSGFYLVWGGLEDDFRHGDGAFVDVAAVTLGTDFVELARAIDPELCFRDRWVAFSPRSAWAIYGEQYGAELAAFLVRDGKAAEAFLAGPVRLMSVPEVLELLIPASAEGAAFASVFTAEYGN